MCPFLIDPVSNYYGSYPSCIITGNLLSLSVKHSQILQLMLLKELTFDGLTFDHSLK